MKSASLVLILVALSAIVRARTHYHSHRAISSVNAGSLLETCGSNSCPAARDRRLLAFNTRNSITLSDVSNYPCQTRNQDEELYPTTRAGSFSKGLLHDSVTGIVNAASFNALVNAIQTGDFSGVSLAGDRKLTNPLAARAIPLNGRDSQAFSQPPAPAFASAEAAAEVIENYWMAVTRDVSFSDYATSPLVAEAVAEMNRMSDFRGPKPVTPQNLFRCNLPGVSTGPYLSQFFFGKIRFGANYIDMRQEVLTPGLDYMTSWDEFLSIQNGISPTRQESLVPNALRYMITGRDLSHWVHIDVLFQAYFEALLFLFQMKIPMKKDLPYQAFSPLGTNMIGFGTYGEPAIASYVAAVASNALEAVWYQKWNVHRRLRPEAFGGRIDRTKRNITSFPVHRDALNANVLNRIFAQHGSYLLPQAFPEGSPMHPSYGAGHATVAGACTTLLKAFFDESVIFPEPRIPSVDGSTLLPWTGESLTVGGELNKIAANVAMGRNVAGVHWRSDADASLKLGEQLAISVLRDIKRSSFEAFPGFRFTAFDGTDVRVE